MLFYTFDILAGKIAAEIVTRFSNQNYITSLDNAEWLQDMMQSYYRVLMDGDK